MRIFMQSDGTAQCWHRILLPARNCAPLLALEGIDLEIGPELGPGYDAYVISRRPTSGAVPWINELHRQGRRIVWSLDDDVWAVPSWSPAAATYADPGLCNWLREIAWDIWVSTDTLRSVVGRGCRVLPNLIDTDYWPVHAQRTPNSPLRVLWAGSAYHEPDLELVASVFEKLLCRYDIMPLFFGSYPTSMSEWIRLKGGNTAMMVPASRYNGRLGFVPPVSIEEYGKVLTILNPDICVAGLVDSTFARSKSNLKWLEYSMTGAATVASPLPPYASCLALTNDLYEDCCSLIEDAEQRRALGAAALTDVLTNWTWKGSKRELWMNAFRLLMADHAAT